MAGGKGVVVEIVVLEMKKYGCVLEKNISFLWNKYHRSSRECRELFHFHRTFHQYFTAYLDLEMLHHYVQMREDELSTPITESA